MPANLTGLQNSTDGFLDYIVTVNNVTGDWYSLGVLLAAFVVSFIAIKASFDTLTALRSSSFITSLVGLGLFGAGLIGIETLMIPLVLLFFTVLVFPLLEAYTR